MKYYIKVVTGFREDQEISVPMQQAHKAYYLFMHPNERGVFDDGYALIGQNIREIKPDYHSTMGYLPTYKMEAEDWLDLNKKHVLDKMRDLMSDAKEVARLAETQPDLLKMKLQEALPMIQKLEAGEQVKMLAEKLKV